MGPVNLRPGWNDTTTSNGDLNMSNKRVRRLAPGVNPTDAVNLQQVQDIVADIQAGADDLTGYLKLNGTREMTGNLDMGGLELVDCSKVNTSQCVVHTSGDTGLLVTDIAGVTKDLTVGGQMVAHGAVTGSEFKFMDPVSGTPTAEAFTFENIGPYMQPPMATNYDIIAQNSVTPYADITTNLGQAARRYKYVYTGCVSGVQAILAPIDADTGEGEAIIVGDTFTPYLEVKSSGIDIVKPGYTITGLPQPTGASPIDQAATKGYVDNTVATAQYLKKDGSVAMTGTLNMAAHNIQNVTQLQSSLVNSDSVVTSNCSVTASDDSALLYANNVEVTGAVICNGQISTDSLKAKTLTPAPNGLYDKGTVQVTGDLDLQNLYKVKSVRTPTVSNEVATKRYVDQAIINALQNDADAPIDENNDPSFTVSIGKAANTFATGYIDNLYGLRRTDNQLQRVLVDGEAAAVDHNHDSTYVKLSGGNVLTATLGPTTDNTVNLGSTSNKFQTGHFGTSIVVGPSATTFTGSYNDLTNKPASLDLATVSTSIIPATTGTYDLGSYDKRFNTLWLSDGISTPNISVYSGLSMLSGSTMYTNNIESKHIVPTTTNVYDLGSSTNKFRTCYVGTSISLPNAGTFTGNASELNGISSYALTTHNHDATYAALNHNHNTAYAALNHNHDTSYAALNHNHDTTYIKLSGGNVLTAAIGPATTNVYDLGGSTNKFRTGYFGTSINLPNVSSFTGNASELNGINAYAPIASPTFTGTVSLPSTTTIGGTAFDSKYIPLSGGNVLTGSMGPSTDNAITLGGVSNKFSNVYATTFTENGTALSSTYAKTSGANFSGNVDFPLGSTIGGNVIDTRYVKVSGGNVLTGALAPSTDNAIALGGVSNKFSNVYATTFTENGTALSSTYAKTSGANFSGAIDFPLSSTISGNSIDSRYLKVSGGMVLTGHVGPTTANNGLVMLGDSTHKFHSGYFANYVVLPNSATFSGNYSDLGGKPSIPDLTNVSVNIVPTTSATYSVGSTTKGFYGGYFVGPVRGSDFQLIAPDGNAYNGFRMENIGSYMAPTVATNYDIIAMDSITPTADDTYNMGQYARRYRNTYTKAVNGLQYIAARKNAGTVTDISVGSSDESAVYDEYFKITSTGFSITKSGYTLKTSAPTVDADATTKGYTDELFNTCLKISTAFSNSIVQQGYAYCRVVISGTTATVNGEVRYNTASLPVGCTVNNVYLQALQYNENGNPSVLGACTLSTVNGTQVKWLNSGVALTPIVTGTTYRITVRFYANITFAAGTLGTAAISYTVPLQRTIATAIGAGTSEYWF